MRVAICTPCRDMVHAGYAFDLARLVGRAVTDLDAQVRVITSPGTLICDQRVAIAKEALATGNDWLLWLDSDMRFPADTLTQLLAREEPIVGANYVTRELPPRPVSKNRDMGGWIDVPTKPGSTGVEEVAAIGLGVALISAEVFKTMDQPWFHLGFSTVNEKFLGEDVYFAIKAKDAGYRILVDHDLSKQVRHVGSFEYRHEHADIVETE